MDSTMFKVTLIGFALSFVFGGNIHWEQYPFCAGNTQSPRAIETASLVDGYDKCVPHLNWIIKHHTTWKVINTGHTIKLTPYNATGTVATLPNQFNPIYDVNGEYCFDSFHFHWGSNDDFGSEHTFDRKRFELEIHFVHYSCDYQNITMAMEASNTHTIIPDPYTLGVIGVMVESTPIDNPSFDLILDELPNVQYPPNTVPNVTGEAIIQGFDIADILPLNRDEFYYYEGSLTTPPCNPIVRWHLLKNNIYISQDQLNILRTAMADTTTPESNNYRELQHNINDVYECLFSSNNNNDGNDNHDEHAEPKKVDKAFVAMIIVGFIAICTLIAVIVEFKNSNKVQTRDKRVESTSNVYTIGSSGGLHSQSNFDGKTTHV